MTKQTKPSDQGDSQVDLKRRRAMMLVAAVTVLGTGLGISMNEVFADEPQRAPPDASQRKSTPKLMNRCVEATEETGDVKPGAQQRKSSPKLMLNCAEGGAMNAPRKIETK